jgi:hypothetical protein
MSNAFGQSSIAHEIYRQLGGRRFRVMTGAKNLLDHGDGLSLRIGRNSSSSNYMKVTLNSMDTYDIRFSKVSKMGAEKSVKEYHNVYNDSLVGLFESHTGLYTSL